MLLGAVFWHAPCQERKSHWTLLAGALSCRCWWEHRCVAGRQSPAQPSTKQQKQSHRQQLSFVCQMQTLGSGWGQGTVFNHFGPLHALIREQASHFSSLWKQLWNEASCRRWNTTSISQEYIWHVTDDGWVPQVFYACLPQANCGMVGGSGWMMLEAAASCLCPVWEKCCPRC